MVGECLYEAQNTGIQDMLKATQPSRYLGTANGCFTTGGSGCTEIYLIIDRRLLKTLVHVFLDSLGLRYILSQENFEHLKLSSPCKASAHICTTSQACHSNVHDKQNKGGQDMTCSNGLSDLGDLCRHWKLESSKYI